MTSGETRPLPVASPRWAVIACAWKSAGSCCRSQLLVAMPPGQGLGYAASANNCSDGGNALWGAGEPHCFRAWRGRWQRLLPSALAPLLLGLHKPKDTLKDAPTDGSWRAILATRRIELTE